MSIQFKSLLKCELGVLGGGNKKQYDFIIYDRPLITDKIVKEIEKFSSLSEPDIRGVIIALENVIQDKLYDGKIIRFKRLGTLYPSIHSTGVATEEEVVSPIIKKVTIRYRPSDRLRESLKIAKLSKVTASKPSTPITTES
jgi:predicted histone-like DNA-binding protein